jgi:hypothetical protein
MACSTHVHVLHSLVGPCALLLPISTSVAAWLTYGLGLYTYCAPDVSILSCCLQLRAQLDLLLQQQAEKEAALTNGDFDEGDQELTNWMNDFDQQVQGLTKLLLAKSCPLRCSKGWTCVSPAAAGCCMQPLTPADAVCAASTVFVPSHIPHPPTNPPLSPSHAPSMLPCPQMAQLRRQAQDMERQVDAKGRLAAELKEQHTQVGCGHRLCTACCMSAMRCRHTTSVAPGYAHWQLCFPVPRPSNCLSVYACLYMPV